MQEIGQTDMRILVTGGAGFIGSHVAERFLADGHEVAIVDDLSTGHLENLPPEATFYRCDIRDPELAAIFQEFRPEVVCHLAAQMSVRISIQRPRFDADTNVVGSINLLESAVAAGTQKIIYASTGGALYGEPRYLPCDEEHPIVPISHYGISKHTVEHYLELYAHLYDLDYTILRFPNVYGPRQDPEGEAGVVAIFIGLLQQGLQATIFGDGLQQRDFVYVSDVAEAHVLALSRGSRAVCNLGSGTGTSVLEIYNALCEVTGNDQPPRFAASRAGEVYRIYLTNQRANQVLGWSPQVALREGLRRTASWVGQQEPAVAAD